MNTLMKRPGILDRFFDDDSFAFPDGWFDDRSMLPRNRRRWEMPAVNVKEDENSFQLEFAVPGFKKEDLKVKVEDGILTVSSEQKGERNEEKKGYTRREFSYSSFDRSFQLPDNVDQENVKASFVDGVLRLGINKIKELPRSNGKEVKIA